MALEQISTGYKPEFALGALYQGFNAGNADNSAQLANLMKEWELQKSQAEDPYKVLSSMYQGQLDNAKMQDPNYIPWQLAGQVGQMQTQESSGRTAQALQPFREAAEKAQFQQTAAQAPLFTNMYQGISQQHDKSLDPNAREAAGQGAYMLADTMSRVDPKNMFQERQLGTKLEGAEDLLGMRLAAQRHQAGLKQKAVAGDKNAQQALVTLYRQKLDAGEMSPQEYALEMASIFNRVTAPKTPPGQQLSQEASGGAFEAKPVTPDYTPRSGGQAPQATKSDPLGIR